MLRVLNLLLLILLSQGCDFTTPVNNELMDFSKPITIFNIYSTQPKIIQQPINEDVTEQIFWTYSGVEFIVTLNSVTTNTIESENGPPIYMGYQTEFDIYLDATKLLEFSGYDSLSSVIEVDITNSNPLYDGLTDVIEKRLMARAFDESTYHEIEDVAELANSAVGYNIQLFFKLRSGVNFSRDYFPNSATYKIRFFIKAKYL